MKKIFIYGIVAISLVLLVGIVQSHYNTAPDCPVTSRNNGYVGYTCLDGTYYISDPEAY